MLEGNNHEQFQKNSYQLVLVFKNQKLSYQVSIMSKLSFILNP